MLKTTLAKVISVVFMVLLLLTITFGYLSYTFYGEKKVIQDNYDKIVQANEDLEESLKIERESSKIDDRFILESIQTNKNLSDIERGTLEKKQRIEQNREVISDVENKEIIKMDDRLPDDVSNLLREHYDSLQRAQSGDNTAR